VFFECRGVRDQEGLQIVVQDLLLAEKLRHRVAGHDGKIAAQQHPVEARDHAADLGRVFVQEALHDLAPDVVDGSPSVSGSEQFGCGRRPR
jgi:hypothetical protein